MIIDTSVLVAILFQESDAGLYASRIAQAERCRMSVATLLEATIVVESGGGAAAGRDLDRLIEQQGIELVPVSTEQVEAARRAWRRFGKGNHPAALNFGDCFTYALAETMQEPLLFKGKDFILTDIERA